MIAKVIINRSAQNINRTFDYNIPPYLESNLRVGMRVKVPFGRGNSFAEGYILEIVENSEYDNLKDILEILDLVQIFDEERLDLAKFVSRECFCNLSDCLNSIVPPGTVSLRKNKEKRQNKKYVIKLSYTIEYSKEQLEQNKIRGTKQQIVLKYILDKLENLENGSIYLDHLLNELSITKSAVDGLVEKGYIFLEDEVIYRVPYSTTEIKKNFKFTPNNEQASAIEAISQACINSEFREILLFGVTGSGKTEVYMHVIEEVLLNGKTAIVLVPEIGLTPQLINRFVGRFGDQIAVLHSKLSDGERYDEWERIQTGQAKIIIGARSAIFAPVKDVGIIIIDEEHDSSYKSGSSPRYYTHDVARYLCKNQNAVLLLGSATPNINMYYKAEQGEIDMYELKCRTNKKDMPKIEIIDMRQELANGNRTMFSNVLKVEIEKNISSKEQTMLFINRRAHSSFVICRDCGYVPTCKNCNVSLHLHNNGKLVCHYCSYKEDSKTVCPMCNSKNIRFFGTGTQKVEEEVLKTFKDVTTIRMDYDTTSKKNSIKDVIDKFVDENINVMVGTKMITKGHDISNVTLVGVMAADSMLNVGDYTSTEQTFQLISQVAGRAGRGDKTGRVVIQTYQPEHYVIQSAANHDYLDFYDQEIMMRKAMNYPPFKTIGVFNISSKNDVQVKADSNKLYNELKVEFEKNIDMCILEPMPAYISKIKNEYIWRIIFKCEYTNYIQEKLQNILNDSLNGKMQSNIFIEINPSNLV